MLGLSFQKYCEWKKVYGQPRTIRRVPRSHWIRPEERQAVIDYKRTHPTTGYRRLTWMMVDEDVAYVSPSTTLRILTEADLNTKWTRPAGEARKTGFDQPSAPHTQWHSDITYVNYRGNWVYLIVVLDGYSRAVLSWDIRTKMETLDVDLVIRRAHEKWVSGTDPVPPAVQRQGRAIQRNGEAGEDSRHGDDRLRKNA